MTPKLFVAELRCQTDGDLRLRLELPGDATLGDLHLVIAAEFDCDPDEPYAFFLSGIPGDERTAFAGPGSAHERPAEEAEIGRLALRAGACIGHTMRDDETWNSLEILEVAPSSPRDEIAVIQREGSRDKTAKQLEAEREIERWQSEFERLKDEVTRALDRDEAPTPDVLRDEFALAQRVLAWAPSVPQAIELLGQEAGVEVDSWLLELPRELFTAGLRDEALSLCERAGGVLAPGPFACEQASLLADAGEAERARAAIEDNLTRYPGDEFVALSAARDLADLGDVERARTMAERMLETTCDPSVAAEAGAMLHDLLEHEQRWDEADRVLDSTRARARELGALANDELAPRPRVGRNDPCPCGSGQKFKKCCGSRGIEDRELRACARVLQDLVAFAPREPDWNEPGRALAEFGGEEFADLSIPESVALFTGEDTEVVFEQWWVLDRRGEDGRTTFERWRARQRNPMLDGERELLERLGASHLGLYRVQSTSGQHVMLVDLLDSGAPPTRVDAGSDSLVAGMVLAARTLELDNELHLMPGMISYDAEEAERVVALLGEARAAWMREHPGSDLASFLGSHGHLFHRIARDLALQSSD